MLCNTKTRVFVDILVVAIGAILVLFNGRVRPRDSGNDLFVPIFSEISVTFSGTRKGNEADSFRFLGYPKKNDHLLFSGTRKKNVMFVLNLKTI